MASARAPPTSITEFIIAGTATENENSSSNIKLSNMLFAGIVFTAVAMFLGMITKLPQGGGGLANNLMILTLFLQAPPLLPPPTPKRILFDLETAIAENQIFYVKNPVVTVNGTQGPMPRPLRKLLSAAGSSNDTVENGPFASQTFASPAFSLPPRLTQYWGFLAIAIGRIVMVFIALCLPWLVTKQIQLLGNAESRLQVASGPILVGFRGLVAQIEPPNPLLENLRLIISERNQALAELRSISEKAREDKKKAAEKDLEMEEKLRGLHAERENALAELDREKEKGTKLEEEKRREEDGLKKETASQLKAWQEKEKKWEDGMANDKKRHKDAVDGLNMGRERELESWRREVEGLKEEKNGEKEAFEANLKNILERMKKEREAWGKEEAAWKEEKERGIAEREKRERERKELEEKRDEEIRSSEEAVDRAQLRITELEEQNKLLQDEAAEKRTKSDEAEATKKVAAEEERSKEKAQKETKKIVENLEKEVLNGRKLIEDLQADKRRDRQMLLELRAQLARQTHAAPPSRINPLRFGGSAPPFMGPPAIAGPSPSSSSSSSTKPPSATPIVNLPSSSSFPPRAIPLLSPRPTVRLPPRPAPAPARVRLPAPMEPPANAPKGPKGS